MKVICDEKTYLILKPVENNFDLFCYKKDADKNIHNDYDIKIGDIDFYASSINIKSNVNILFSTSVPSVQLTDLKLYNFYQIIVQNDISLLKVTVDQISTALRQHLSLSLVKEDFFKKRNHLERLNHFLQGESSEKSDAIQIFVDDENTKKNREKKLLYFLDFLNSEYEKPDFLEIFCRLIWTDLKKMGSFQTLIYVIQLKSKDYAIITFNGYSLNIKNVDHISDQMVSSAQGFFANLLQRPVGLLKTWSLQNERISQSVFLETHSVISEVELNSYFTDRLSLIGLAVQRHILQTQSEYFLNKWNKIVQAHRDPVIVVDKEFNLFISNLDDESSNHFLAHSKNINLESFVYINHKKYKVTTTRFMIDKEYSILFYSNQTEIDELKSKVIQNEKMNVIGQLANHLAHELNNPLTGLKLASEFLISLNDTQHTVKMDLNEVLKATGRCQGIISDLLDFSGEAKQIDEIVLIDEILKKTLPLLKAITRSHHIYSDIKPVSIRCSSNYVQQILFNLIKNACQALPEKSFIKIYDHCHGSFYDLIVEDNGPGLPDVIKSNLFQPFTTTKDIGVGTGLGLYISQQLALRMSSQLIYDNQFKQGTRFILRFNI